MARLAKAADCYHHGDLREALVRATMKVVRTSGPEGVSLRAVAREANVSEAAPYHHFRDKRELLAAAAEVGFEALGARLSEAVQRHARDPRAALIAMALAWVEFALDRPGSFRLLFGAHVEELAKAPATRKAGQAAKAVARQTVEAWLGPERPDRELVFRSIWAQVHGTAWLALENELGPDFTRTDALELARTGVERLLDGYRARAASANTSSSV